LLPPLLLVHASQLKQRHQQFHRLDKNSKGFLRLQKMFNFIRKSEIALPILKHIKSSPTSCSTYLRQQRRNRCQPQGVSSQVCFHLCCLFMLHS
ncbi:hypothetical protein T11_7474, partial [Trichinella zimbabwensis]